MTYDEMIEVLKAAKAGKKIEWQAYAVSEGDKSWRILTGADPKSFNFISFNYRVMKEPRILYAVGNALYHQEDVAKMHAEHTGLPVIEFVEKIK